MSDEYLKLNMEQQVIYQLLLKHNIITRQEVEDMRIFVRQQEPYKSAMDNVEQGEAFGRTFANILRGDSVTEKERRSALRFLDNIIDGRNDKE